MTERLFITGLGVISPLGSGLETYWKGLLERTDPPAQFDDPQFAPDLVPNRSFHRVIDRFDYQQRRMGRASAMAIDAARMCRDDATIEGLDRTRTGVAIGTGAGNADVAELDRGGVRPSSDREIFGYSIAADVATDLDLEGPTVSASTACSAGAYALGLAADLIRDGSADAMIVGGVEGYSRVTQACFNRLMALDSRCVRPFSADRGGTILGEGAAVLLIESERSLARRRTPHIWGELKGWGWSCDGHHQTAPDESGRFAELAVRNALAHARLDTTDVDCVIPHATGTKLNDKIESAALTRVFGEHLHALSISAIKSKLGHGSGSSALFSCLTAALILKHGVVPPTGNVAPADLDCGVPVHTGEPALRRVNNVLVNAYAFGGNNMSMIVGRADG